MASRLDLFVRRNPELPLPLITNYRPQHDALSGGCVGREAGRKQKTQSSEIAVHQKNGIHRKQKAVQRMALRKIQEIKFFFLTRSPYLCDRLSEL